MRHGELVIEKNANETVWKIHDFSWDTQKVVLENPKTKEMRVVSLAFFSGSFISVE